MARQMYDAWGKVRVRGDLKTDIGYTAQREDVSINVMFYRARFYSPALGRFLSADTIVPGAGNPQSLNRYTYVRNRPLNYIDPSGHRIACNDFKEGACGGLQIGLTDTGAVGAAGQLAGAEAVLSSVEMQVLLVRTLLLSAQTTANVRRQTSQERTTTRRYDTTGDPDCAGCGYQLPPSGTAKAVHDIGVEQGRTKAIEQGLEPIGWQNPFAGRGAYGQGFDDVMRAPNGDLVIVEYKGGTGKLASGQMGQQWVKNNIWRLIQAGDPMGFQLQTAFNEGTLSGVVYSTPIVNGIPQLTVPKYWFWYGP